MDLSYLEAMMGEMPEEEIYSGILVFAEVEDGRLSPVTLEVLGKARDMAEALGVYVKAALLGDGVDELAQELIRHGADHVYLAQDPALASYSAEAYSHVLAHIVEQSKPEILLLGATSLGNDLAPRLAQKLSTGLATNCVGLELDELQRLLLAVRPLYGGRYFQVVAIPKARPQMATLKPGYFRPHPADEYRTGEVEAVAVDLEGVKVRTRLLRVVEEEEREEEPLSRARIVVSGGRGMGDPEHFALVKELARLLGGTVGGSRGAVEEGWVEEERQVGMGGTIISPDLYIACGISGAIQHYFGVQDARFVVAINKDERAPIFKVADVGVVGDARKILPALIRELGGSA